MTTVLIGSEGLVGRHLKAALEKISTVLCVTRSKGLEFVSETSQPTAVVFVAQSNDYKSSTFTKDLFDVNVNLLHQCLQRFANTNCKFIYFSTGSVYKKQEADLDINSPLDYLSQNPYVISKLMGEQMAQTFTSLYSAMHIVRPFFIYGPGQNSQMLIQSLINRIKNGEQISLSGESGLIFNPVYVDDCVQFTLSLINNSESYGIHYHNLAGPQQCSLRQIVEFIFKQLGIEPNLVITGSNDNKLVAITNQQTYTPTITIEQGLQLMLRNEQG